MKLGWPTGLRQCEQPIWQPSIFARGFAVIHEVLGASEISVLQEELSSAPLRRSRAGARHLLNNLDCRNLGRRSAVDENRSSNTRCKRPFRTTLFDKSPTSNWLVVWHQDTALPLRERREVPGWGPWSVKEGVIYALAPAEALEEVLALRLHLDDSSDENGPLRVLPGTHTKGVLTDDAIEGLAAEINSVDGWY